MDVVILHYHLNRGGVTRVIENHVRALALHPKPPRRVFIVYGGRAAAWTTDALGDLPFSLELVVHSEWDYDASHPSSVDGLTRALADMLRSHGCEPDSTVIHIHNHSLGKKAALPAAISRWAQDGWRFLLQIHDFAEDLRPSNYRHLVDQVGSIDAVHQQLYPQAPQIQYAVLNQRDHDLLLKAGIDAAHLHPLPNAVAMREPPRQIDEARARRKLVQTYQVPTEHSYYLYPVRGIRRKNIGELLLWSAVIPDATFAVTLAPLNPRELASYEAWSECARDLHLPVVFDAGRELSLDENYAAADGVVTTSVAEGFGLVFLEAAVANRPLFGRDLPGITADFRTAGMQFPGLAESIWIPVDWVDVKRLKQLHVDCLQRLHTSFELPTVTMDDLRKQAEASFAGDVIDFGQLDSRMQRDVLRHVRSDAGAQQALQDHNVVMRTIAERELTSLHAGIDTNRRVLEHHYSLPGIARRLGEIYGIALAATPHNVESPPAIGRSLLECFLTPTQLFPIRLDS